VGIGIGSYFGLRTFSTWSQAKSDCGAGCPDGSNARAEQSDARTFATVSTIAFVAGGAALAAGGYLLLSAPSPSSHGPASADVRVGPWITASGGGASLLIRE
jgi:hypothetical protein